MNVLITGGIILTDGMEFSADLAIRDGKVQAIGHDLPSEGAEVVEAAGCYVLPGLIDVDALADAALSGQLQADEIEKCTTRALRAGFATYCVDYPLGPQGTRALDHLRQNSRQDLVLRAAVGQSAQRGAAVESLRNGGASALRATLRQLGALGAHSEAELLALLRECPSESRLFLFHENGPLGAMEQQAAVREVGSKDPRALRQAMHPHYLGEIGLRVLSGLVREVRQRRVLAMPITTFDEVALLVELRSDDGGNGLLSATSLPYLAFKREDFESGLGGRLPAGYPPIRTSHDQTALWQAVRAGLIDAIGTAATTGGEDGLGAPEFLLPVLLTQAIERHRLRPADFTRLLTDNPAKILGVYPSKGTLMPGADGDVVLFDPTAPTPEPANGSPYKTLAMKGRVVGVLRGGEIVLRDGEAAGEPSPGKVLKPVAAELLK